MKRKNLFSFAVSIIMVIAIIMVSACGQKTTTTAATTTTTTPGTTPTTTTATTTIAMPLPVMDTPVVTFTVNANGATNVPINTKVGVFFTEPMNPSTLNTSTFTLMQGSTPVSGTVNYNGSGVTFTPAATLTPNTVYTATITAGAKDLSGKALANPYVWSWTTGSAPDVTPPMVTSTINANGATNVSINTKVGAFFTEAIDPLTITSTTFTLMQGTTPVAGTVNGVAFAVTFTPATSLTPNTVYTATLTTGVKDLAGNALASPYTWSWTTAAVPDTTSPTVSSTIPVNNDTSMSINSALAAVFSEAMDPSTVNSATFILMQGATLVPGTVTYLGVTAAFVPTTALAYNTMYTATISTGAKDLAGNPLAANYQWSFTTNNNGGGGGVTLSSDKAITSFSFVLPAVTGIINETAKTIAVTVPVGTNLTALVATFTTTGTGVKVGTMSQTSIATPNNFTSPVAYVVTAADASTATYTVTVTIASSSAKAITAYSFAGYTGAVGTINETAKTIAVTVPFGTPLTALVATFTTTGAVVNVGTTVQTSLSTPNNFTSPVAYIVTAGDASTATYTVTVTIASNSAKAITAYSFAGYTGAGGTINETAKTIAVTVPYGTPLTALVATFTTTGTGVKVGTTVQTSTATPNDFTSPVVYTVTAGDASTVNYTVTVTVSQSIVLGLAGTFAILATSAISGSGNHITGDVGLNPGSAQGIAPSEITGNIHVDDTAVINAQASLLAAFNDAVSRSTNAQSLPGNLGGLTKAPGLYVNGSSSGISGTGANAILTLDAGGDPNAVFIFKMSSTFVMDPGTSIVLSGSAKAQNVYFWVGSSATLDTTTIFKGIILAAVTITVNNGANIVGSLFAGAAGGTGAVTVQGSTIAIPTP